MNAPPGNFFNQLLSVSHLVTPYFLKKLETDYNYVLWPSQSKSLLQLVSNEGKELLSYSDLFPVAGYGALFIISLYSLNGLTELQTSRALRISHSQLNGPRTTCPVSSGFWVIFGLNSVILALLFEEANEPFMKKHFLLTTERMNLTNLIGAGFCHASLIHLGLNMFTFYQSLETWKKPNHSTCTHLVSCNGTEFLTFYMSAIVVSNFVGLACKVLLEIPYPTLGASGAIACMDSYNFWKRNRTMTIPLFGYEYSEKQMLACIIMVEFHGFMQMVASSGKFVSTDYSVHLGGYLYGIWYVNGGDRALKSLGNFLARLVDPVYSYLIG